MTINVQFEAINSCEKSFVFGWDRTQVLTLASLRR